MREVKGDQNPHTKKQTAHRLDENEFHRTVSNRKEKHVRQHEEILLGKTENNRRGGKDSVEGANSGNLRITQGICDDSKNLQVLGEIEESGNKITYSQSPKPNIVKTISKSGIIPTSSSISLLSSQGFVGDKSVSVRERTKRSTDVITERRISVPDSTNTQDSHAQVEVNRIPTVIETPLKSTTLPRDSNNFENSASIAFSQQSAPPSLTNPTHGFRFKDAVGIQVENSFVRQHIRSDVLSSNRLGLEEKSTHNPENVSKIQSVSSGGSQMTSMGPKQPVIFSLGRPRSNSVPNSTDKNLVSSESKLKNQSKFLPNSRGTVGRISSRSQPISKSGSLRRGKWTVEEETYVARVIQDFNAGYLDAPAGTTLRTFLSDKLNCDPMRITKKFTGDACIGKRVFHPAIRCLNNASIIDKAQNELISLEHQWRRRIELQRQESVKKQAASVAAAAVAASGRLHLRNHISNRLTTTETPHKQPINTSSNDLAQTASWLDRANAILSNTKEKNEQLKMKISHGDSVEKEMEEVQRLIHEGPKIQKTSAGFTMLLENGSDLMTSNDSTSKQKVTKGHLSTEVPRLQTKSSNSSINSVMSRTNIDSASILNDISEAPPATKRLRKIYSTSNLESVAPSDNAITGAAEDAATLMGFLTSVRQAAASGGTPLKR